MIEFDPKPSICQSSPGDRFDPQTQKETWLWILDDFGFCLAIFKQLFE